MFRTTPLWGIGQRLFFLHDGRTNDLLAAIAAHASAGDPEIFDQRPLSAVGGECSDQEVRRSADRPTSRPSSISCDRCKVLGPTSGATKAGFCRMPAIPGLPPVREENRAVANHGHPGPSARRATYVDSASLVVGVSTDNAPRDRNLETGARRADRRLCGT